MLLSYIPFKHPVKKSSSGEITSKSISPDRSVAGDASMMTMNEEERNLEQREIKCFVQQAF